MFSRGEATNQSWPRIFGQVVKWKDYYIFR
jgi:hypothetical protein